MPMAAFFYAGEVQRGRNSLLPPPDGGTVLKNGRPARRGKRVSNEPPGSLELPEVPEAAAAGDQSAQRGRRCGKRGKLLLRLRKGVSGKHSPNKQSSGIL